jgi:hypothetical protein
LLLGSLLIWGLASTGVLNQLDICNSCLDEFDIRKMIAAAEWPDTCLERHRVIGSGFMPELYSGMD